MKYIASLLTGLFCLLFITACPTRTNIIIANKNSETIELLYPNGKRDILLKSGDIKKTAFPNGTMEQPHVSLIRVRIGAVIYDYEFSRPRQNKKYINDKVFPTFKVVFHKDRKFYIIPYEASWDDPLENHEQPEGWPLGSKPQSGKPRLIKRP